MSPKAKQALGIGIFIVIGIAVARDFSSGDFQQRRPPAASGGVGSEMLAFCRDSPEKVADVLSRARQLSVIKGGIGSERVDIDERLWAELPHDAKVSVAIAAWCRIADGPDASVFLFGWRDGDIHASMIAGNYSD